MRSRSRHIKLLACLLAVALVPSAAFAKKDDPNKPPKDSTAQEQATPGSPGQGSSKSDKKDKKEEKDKVKLSSEQRWLMNVRDQLKVSDPEWDVLAPRILHVMQLQRELNYGHDPRGPREPKPPKERSPDAPAPPPLPDVLAKSRELNATLFNESAAPSEVKTKVVAIRDARAKLRRELTGAQEDLRQLLTYRQEAVLIIMGLLE